MKAIVLISSIFYLLGLKIGHNPDPVKNNQPAGIVQSEKISKPACTDKNYCLKSETKNDRKIDPDSLKCKKSPDRVTPEVSNKISHYPKLNFIFRIAIYLFFYMAT